ncbi:MAG: hypothetical protein ABL916_21215 [Burkholderiaceae bacterium]
MYTSFGSFRTGQLAAKHFAKKIRATVSLVHVSGFGWQVHLETGEEIEELRKPFALPVPTSRESIATDEYHAAREEHEHVNAAYYEEQRVLNEGTQEEYIRYLYGP